MPPKKKVRLSSRTASTPPNDAVKQAKKEGPAPSKESLGKEIVISDPWTDEQETSLFKSMIRWKPVGMHKHFRMIAISENLRNHGYFSPQNAHTRIPGIWKKLSSLYNLETLDAREDTFGEPIQIDGDPAQQPFCPFALPEDEYRDMMFARRLAPGGTSSPPLLAHQLSSMSIEGGRAARRYSTVDDTDDPRSSPASVGGPKRGRNTRTSKGARTSLLAEVSTAEGGQGNKESVSRGTDDGQDDEEGGEAVEEDEKRNKAAMQKDTSKGSKVTASKNSVARRSGRRR